jgi:hypothetical protein
MLIRCAGDLAENESSMTAYAMSFQVRDEWVVVGAALLLLAVTPLIWLIFRKGSDE